MAAMEELASLRGSRKIEQIVPAQEPRDHDCAAVILEVYTLARPQDAFEAAVRVYRERNSGATLSAARRAVAAIICGRV
jgi:hypothetical protein